MPPVVPNQQSSRAREYASVGFPWRVLVIAIVVFGLSILVYAGMAFGYTPYLTSQIKSVDGEFTALSESLDADQQQNLIDFYSQLYNIDTLSNTHVYPSHFFDFLERNTYPTVRFSLLQLNVSGGEARLEGIADDFAILSDQISVFQNSPDVASVTLDASRQRDAADGSGVFFSLKVQFQKGFFTQKLSS